VPTYSDEEIDYLFALIEGQTLEGTTVSIKRRNLCGTPLWRTGNKLKENGRKFTRRSKE
jgi:hypothetical protein